MVYNVLDYPGGVVRMTSVTEDDNELMRNYPEHDMFHRRVKEVGNIIIKYESSYNGDSWTRAFVSGCKCSSPKFLHRCHL